MRNQVFAIHAIAAAGSVTLGTALTYPLDTAKVILQVGYLNFVIRLAYLFFFLVLYGINLFWGKKLTIN